MKYDTIIQEIDKRITTLEEKRKKLIITEMAVKERNRRDEEYQEEIYKLYALLRNR
jgi:hypothetical protein